MIGNWTNVTLRFGYRLQSVYHRGRRLFHKSSWRFRLPSEAYQEAKSQHWQFVAASGVAGITAAVWLPETFLITHYKHLQSAAEDGEERPVDPSLLEKAKEILDSLKLPVYRAEGVEYFTCVGQDPIVLGATTCMTGASIGLPDYLRYRCIEDFDMSTQRLGSSDIAWDSLPGQELRKSLIFSDEALNFILLRQICYADSYRVHMKAGLTACWSGAAYCAYYTVSRLTPGAHWTGHAVLAGFACTIGLLMYVLSNDSYHVYLDRKVDKRCIKHGAAAGGAQYYAQIMQRNRNLRELLGPDGDKLYTATGNERQGLRTKSLQLSSRLQMCQDAVKSIEE